MTGYLTWMTVAVLLVAVSSIPIPSQSHVTGTTNVENLLPGNHDDTRPAKEILIWDDSDIDEKSSSEKFGVRSMEVIRTKRRVGARPRAGRIKIKKERLRKSRQ
nr:uncharacterized protein LOC128690806 [Cherax quadricarinatus]